MHVYFTFETFSSFFKYQLIVSYKTSTYKLSTGLLIARWHIWSMHTRENIDNEINTSFKMCTKLDLFVVQRGGKPSRRSTKRSNSVSWHLSERCYMWSKLYACKADMLAMAADQKEGQIYDFIRSDPIRNTLHFPLMALFLAIIDGVWFQRKRTNLRLWSNLICHGQFHIIILTINIRFCTFHCHFSPPHLLRHLELFLYL